MDRPVAREYVFGRFRIDVAFCQLWRDEEIVPLTPKAFDTLLFGGFQGRASQFDTLGAGFGFVFALIAGLAATFTACNWTAIRLVARILYSL